MLIQGRILNINKIIKTLDILWVYNTFLFDKQIWTNTIK